MEKFLYGTSDVTVDDETGVKDAVVVEKEITANGTYIASNEPKVDGKTVDGYSEVEVDVQPNLQVGTGTVNGETYYPSQGYDGFSEFTVNIPADTNVTHEIHYTADNTDVYFTIINQDKTNYSNFDSLFTALWDKGARSASTALNASGTSYDDTVTKVWAQSFSGGVKWIIFSGTQTNYDLNNVTITDYAFSGSANLLGQKNITQNGLYGAESEGYDGYRSVYVNVPMSRTPRLQSKTAQASSSQQVITYDTGYDGLQQVTIGAIAGTYSISSNGEYDIAQYGKVSVNVGTANIDSIGTVRENRTYTASEYGLSGISSFTVRVPLNLQTTKTVSVSRNDIYTFTADSEYNGLQQIVVDVNVPRNVNVKPETFTANGIYQIPQDYDGYGVVTVNVPLENKKSARYTTNGVFTITPSSPNTAMKEVEVEVAVNNSTTTKTITSNGVYSANDDGVLGYSEVTVNVMKLKGVIDGSITGTITFADLAGLTRVRAYVFYKCKPTNGFSIELPNTIASDIASDGSVGIGAYAFAESNLTSIKVENNGYFLPILNHAFYKCTMLDTVDLGDSPFNFTTIGNNGHTHLFAECGTITNFIIRYPQDPLDPDILDEGITSGYAGENSNFENTTITNLYVPSEWVQYYITVWKTRFGIATNVYPLGKYNG